MAARRAPFWRIAAAGLLVIAAIPASGASRRQPQPPPPGKGPVEYLKSLLPWTEVGPAPDFVEQSRPAQPGAFIPVGAEPPEQQLRVKSAAELAAMKADMELARTAHENLRAHPPALTTSAAPAPAAAAAPVPAVKKPAAKRGSKRKPAAAAAD